MDNIAEWIITLFLLAFQILWVSWTFLRQFSAFGLMKNDDDGKRCLPWLCGMFTSLLFCSNSAKVLFVDYTYIITIRFFLNLCQNSCGNYKSRFTYLPDLNVHTSLVCLYEVKVSHALSICTWFLVYFKSEFYRLDQAGQSNSNWEKIQFIKLDILNQRIAQIKCR